MISYDYNLSDAFINGVNPTCLDKTIEMFGFPNELAGVNVEYETDTVTVMFLTELSPTDKDELDTLIAIHNPLTTCDFIINSDMGGTKVDFILNEHSEHEYIYNMETTWGVGTSFIYEGSLNWVPRKLSVIASLKEESTGHLRLYDITNNNEICSLSWTNVEKGIVSTDVFSNIPTVPALIELQFKTENKNKEARLHYLALY